MNNDGLKRMYLIQSAEYQYVNLDLSDTTLLLGASGVGKTTLMRAILFFYTMDDSMLNIDESSKEPFTRWYFKNKNSHIIYEYTKENNRYLFIVSSRGKLHYTFVDITNSSIGVNELFLEDKIPANLQVLNENIQKNNLPNFDTYKKEEYINTFHFKDSDNKKIKQKSNISFALFNDILSRKEFAKTLSNIFKTSKITSNDIKETIVSLIDDSVSNINLLDIKRNFSDYTNHKYEIKNFEKRIPNIQKLSDSLENYFDSKKEFKEKANEIKAIKDKCSHTIESKRSKIDKFLNDKEDLTINFKVNYKILQKHINKQKEIISIKSNTIKELIEKDKEYKQKNIANLLLEYNKKSSYIESLRISNYELDALTSSQNEIRNKYEKILNRLEQNKNSELLKIKEIRINKDRNISLNIESLLENRDKIIENKTQKLKDEKIKIDNQLLCKQEKFKNTEIAQAKLENFSFNLENIESFKKLVKQYEMSIFKIHPNIIDNQHKLDNIEKEILNIPILLNRKKESLLNEKDSKRKELFEEKEDIEKKLNFDSNNLYGFINNSNLKYKEKIVTYIKDDILFSTNKFNALEVNNSDTIFGLKVEFSDSLSCNYGQNILLENLKEVKTKIRELNKEIIEENEKFEKEANRLHKEKSSIKNNLIIEKNKLAKNKEKYEEYKIQYSEELEKEKQKANKLKSEEYKRLNKLYLEDESIIQSLSKSILDLNNKIKSIEDIVKKSTQNDINKLKKESKNFEKIEKNGISKINSDYEQNKYNTNQKLTKAFSLKGVDIEALEKYKNIVNDLEIKLASIEKYNRDVIIYQNQFQEQIKNIPNLRDDLREEKRILSEKNKQEEKNKQDFDKKIFDIDKNINQYKNIKESLEKFILKYDNNITNTQIQNDINNVISFENKANIESLLENNDFMDEVVNNIIEIYNRINKYENDIVKYLNQSLNGLNKNNIFKIEVINDYIETNILKLIRIANDLVEYVDKDKIRVFKEESSNMFRSSIHSIIKSLDMYNNAVQDVYSEVKTLSNTVRKAVESFQVINNIYIKVEDSNNEILNAIKSLSEFYNNNIDKLLDGLFTDNNAQDELSSRIKDLMILLNKSKEKLYLKDGFLLKFKVIEKNHDLNWRETLNDIGSNGTSTLVKSNINISMLQMVNKGMNSKNEIVSHCILDEIGTISTDYFRELKNFVNSSGFHFVNGMPVEDDMLISMYPTVYVGEDCNEYSKMELISKEVI